MTETVPRLSYDHLRLLHDYNYDRFATLFMNYYIITAFAVSGRSASIVLHGQYTQSQHLSVSHSSPVHTIHAKEGTKYHTLHVPLVQFKSGFHILSRSNPRKVSGDPARLVTLTGVGQQMKTTMSLFKRWT